MIKNPPASAGATRKSGSIPGLGRTPKGMAPSSNILPRKIPWREEPGGIQSMRSQRVGHV